MRYIFIILSFIITADAISQNSEGVIVYNQKVNVHKMMGDRAEQFKDMIPEFRNSKMELQFKGTETLYQAAKDQGPQNDIDVNGGGGRFRMRMMRAGGGGSSMTYRNLEANTSVESTEFMTKKFLIKGEFEDQEWKMTGETKMINNMMCMKATTIDSVVARQTMIRGGGHNGETEDDEKKPQDATKEARKITAWFTPSIPVQAGPENFGNLPGLILELDINDGDTVFSLDKLELKELETKIEEPTKGKEVTREEYRKIVREKMKEMREQGGGGFRVIRQG